VQLQGIAAGRQLDPHEIAAFGARGARARRKVAGDGLRHRIALHGQGVAQLAQVLVEAHAFQVMRQRGLGWGVGAE